MNEIIKQYSDKSNIIDIDDLVNDIDIIILDLEIAKYSHLDLNRNNIIIINKLLSSIKNDYINNNFGNNYIDNIKGLNLSNIKMGNLNFNITHLYDIKIKKLLSSLVNKFDDKEKHVYIKNILYEIIKD